jgi:hypothetical protein
MDDQQKRHLAGPVASGCVGTTSAQARCRRDPGRIVRDLAVMVADGGDCLAVLGAVRERRPLFGAVASNATAFRVIDRIAGDRGRLDALRAARARARENAW